MLRALSISPNLETVVISFDFRFNDAIMYERSRRPGEEDWSAHIESELDHQKAKYIEAWDPLTDRILGALSENPRGTPKGLVVKFPPVRIGSISKSKRLDHWLGGLTSFMFEVYDNDKRL